MIEVEDGSKWGVKRHDRKGGGEDEREERWGERWKKICWRLNRLAKGLSSLFKFQ